VFPLNEHMLVRQIYQWSLAGLASAPSYKVSKMQDFVTLLVRQTFEQVGGSWCHWIAEEVGHLHSESIGELSEPFGIDFAGRV